MTTKRVNVERGKKGFQETTKSEPSELNLAQSANTHVDALTAMRDECRERLTYLDEESFANSSALIMEKVRETRPHATDFRVRVQYDNGNLTPGPYDLPLSPYDRVSSNQRVNEYDDDFESIAATVNMLTPRNRRHIWRTGRSPLGGPAYATLNLPVLSDDESENLGVRRTEVAVAIIEAENELMLAETTLSALALRDVGFSKVSYEVSADLGGECTGISATEVYVLPGFDRYYTRDSARQHAAKIIYDNMSSNSLRAITEHQVNVGVPSVIDRYNTEYNPLDNL